MDALTKRADALTVGDPFADGTDLGPLISEKQRDRVHNEIVGPSVARELVAVFLGATFDGGERYVARLDKVAAMEKEMKSGEVTAA